MNIRQHYQLIAAVALVIGIVLITIAEMPDLHWTRVFGATLITLGAVGLGIYVGLSNPGRFRAIADRLSPLKVPIGVAVVALLFLPVILGLAGGLVGLFAGPGATGWTLALGVLILLLMIGATAAGGVVALRAIVWTGEMEQEAETDGERR